MESAYPFFADSQSSKAHFPIKDRAQAPNRCGAKTRSGRPCEEFAIKRSRRCRLHGGLSTGPRTAEGKAKIGAAQYKHGRYVNYRAKRQLEKFFLGQIRHLRAEARSAGIYADQLS